MNYLQGKTLPQLIRHVVTHIHSPEHPFLLFRGAEEYESISYREAIEKTDAISSWLLEAGIGRGDRLGLLIENSPEYIHFDQALQQIGRSEEHTSELQSLMRISYAVFCLKKKNIKIRYYTRKYTRRKR